LTKAGPRDHRDGRTARAKYYRDDYSPLELRYTSCHRQQENGMIVFPMTIFDPAFKTTQRTFNEHDQHRYMALDKRQLWHSFGVSLFKFYGTLKYLQAAMFEEMVPGSILERATIDGPL
jgi:hypothetical protein